MSGEGKSLAISALIMLAITITGGVLSIRTGSEPIEDVAFLIAGMFYGARHLGRSERAA